MTVLGFLDALQRPPRSSAAATNPPLLLPRRAEAIDAAKIVGVGGLALAIDDDPAGVGEPHRGGAHRLQMRAPTRATLPLAPPRTLRPPLWGRSCRRDFDGRAKRKSPFPTRRPTPGARRQCSCPRPRPTARSPSSGAARLTLRFSAGELRRKNRFGGASSAAQIDTRQQGLFFVVAAAPGCRSPISTSRSRKSSYRSICLTPARRSFNIRRAENVRRSSTARSRSGNRWRSSNMSRRNSRKSRSGRAARARGRWRAR